MLEKKIPPPIVMLVFALLMWAVSQATPRLAVEPFLKNVVAVIIFLIAMVFDMVSLYWFKKHKTTINPLKPEATKSLVINGTYKISRNPMYVGLALLLSGWSIYLAAPLSMVGIVGFVFYITYFQIKPEERALEMAFGAEYLRYKASVRRWL